VPAGKWLCPACAPAAIAADTLDDLPGDAEEAAGGAPARIPRRRSAPVIVVISDSDSGAEEPRGAAQGAAVSSAPLRAPARRRCLGTPARPASASSDYDEEMASASSDSEVRACTAASINSYASRCGAVSSGTAPCYAGRPASMYDAPKPTCTTMQ